ncbi:MAG: endonuclease domain-containing protein, partial [Deltaproteobacteria bacterium]
MGEGEGGGDLRLSKDITPTAKTLRKRLTDTERLLWTYLRAKQLEGFKFRRQEPIGRYIADFVCYEKRIVIEVDGGQHGHIGATLKPVSDPDLVKVITVDGSTLPKG